MVVGCDGALRRGQVRCDGCGWLRGEVDGNTAVGGGSTLETCTCCFTQYVVEADRCALGYTRSCAIRAYPTPEGCAATLCSSDVAYRSAAIGLLYRSAGTMVLLAACVRRISSHARALSPSIVPPASPQLTRARTHPPTTKLLPIDGVLRRARKAPSAKSPKGRGTFCSSPLQKTDWTNPARTCTCTCTCT